MAICSLDQNSTKKTEKYMHRKLKRKTYNRKMLMFDSERTIKSLKKVSPTESQCSHDASPSLLSETTVIVRQLLPKYFFNAFRTF